MKNWEDEDEVKAYLAKMLNKEVFDKRGLIYGMGHAVYSISDPRATIFKGFVEKLAKDKGREEDFKFYSMIERLAPQVIVRNAIFTRALVRTWTSTVALCIVCWIFRWSCIHQFCYGENCWMECS